MKFSLFRKIIDDLAGHKEFKLLDMQMWGEPLMNPDIFRMIRYATGSLNNVRLSTNGLLLDRRATRKLIKNPPHHLRISIDASSPETYNKIRCGGDFNKVVENVKTFFDFKKGRNPTTSVQLIEMQYNRHEVEDFIKTWRHIADDVWIIRLSSVGNLTGNYDKIAVNNQSDNKKYTCGTLWKRMYVYSNGDVPFCGNDINGISLIGDLKRQSVKDVWNSKEAFRIRKSLIHRKNMKKECITCKDWDMCGTYDWRHIITARTVPS